MDSVEGWSKLALCRQHYKVFYRWCQYQFILIHVLVFYYLIWMDAESKLCDVTTY